MSRKTPGTALQLYIGIALHDAVSLFLAELLADHNIRFRSVIKQLKSFLVLELKSNFNKNPDNDTDECLIVQGALDV